MKRKNLIVAALCAGVLMMTGCGEPSATQRSCDQIAELYESVDQQWLPEITTGIKDHDAAHHAEHVAQGWQSIAASSDDAELAELMNQLQPVLDTYRQYADQPMGDHPADDAENQRVWVTTSTTIGEMCNNV